MTIDRWSIPASYSELSYLQIRLCCTRQLCIWLRLAGWQPCWGKACHLALHILSHSSEYENTYLRNDAYFEKINVPDGIRPRPIGVEIQCSEPQSRLPNAVCQRLYLYDTLCRIAVVFIEAMHRVICQPDIPTMADNLE